MSPRPDLSVQLFSVREQLAADFSGTIATLAKIGLTRVEPFGMVNFAEQLKVALADNGLSAPTSHQSLVDIELTQVLDVAADLGVGTVIHPFTPPADWTTRTDVERVAEVLSRAAERAAGYGIRIGYHNHDWELRLQLEGTTSLELLLSLVDPAVVLEVDTYWAAVGGQDVPELLGRLGDRVVALHLKDGPLTGVTADQLPLGSGDLPAAEILAAVTALEVPVIEFDQYAGDIFDGISAAYGYATSTLGFSR
ncbi:MAG: sugar phosphate isomerase/epimerase [Nakamurella sp.]